MKDYICRNQKRQQLKFQVNKSDPEVRIK